MRPAGGAGVEQCDKRAGGVSSRYSGRDQSDSAMAAPFDMTMTWLPGAKVPGQDVDNAEYADAQMGFGFTLGDETIAEPYFT